MALTALPHELLLRIISLLEPEEAIAIQQVATSLRTVARDSNLWKEICFEYSRHEVNRRRLERLAAEQEEQLAQLRQAFQGIANNDRDFTPDTSASSHAAENLSVSAGRMRALVNWDPTHPGEHIDFYDEYRQRHGSIVVDWFQECRQGRHGKTAEAMGVGRIVDEQNEVQYVAAPMADGSLCVWQASSDSDSGNEGNLIAQSEAGLLSAKPDESGRLESITNETGAIENASIDSRARRGYFAFHDTLAEVDLNTLQVISRSRYAFPVSCISPVEPFCPMTVGTSHTVHLFDSRASRQQVVTEPTEQIAGTDLLLFSSLAETGPLSILHHPLPGASHEIWIGGRFKSLLCYDRRFWPRVSKTLFSGARLSSISALPYPFVPRELGLNLNLGPSITDRNNAKAAPGATLIAAGEYKGKGSLELYNLVPNSRDSTTSHATAARYQNRQTASRTRLLSVTPHGSRIVFSDGDGNLKWTERDGSTPVREFNINDHIPRIRQVPPGSSRGAEIRTVYHDRTDSGIGTPTSTSSDEEVAEGVFAEGENGDIVQRVMPTGSKQNDLLIWTADGRLGIVGFGRGRGPDFGKATNGKARPGADGTDDDPDEREEQLFGMRMRRALERQADEARFVRSLGVGGRWRPG